MYSKLKNENPMPKVNLDALIPRADFAEDKTIQGATELKLLNIQYLMPKDKSATSKYHLFRKPDFQRETNNWDKKRIADLIECFIDEKFIPAIILWQNPSTKVIYVIDGAHRLSALLAWINNDYGDGAISKEYYQHTPLPEAEMKLADETRNYIKKRIGSFDSICDAQGAKWDIINSINIDIQVVPGNVIKAEDSFFKINQQGVVISTTEKQLCKYRNSPISIATRIILKGAAGHQYWNSFIEDNMDKVPAIAAEVHDLIFNPPYGNDFVSVIRDHPLGGSVPGGMQTIHELENIISAFVTPNEKVNDINDSKDGKYTLSYLELTRKICRIMLSNTPGSLGLFPSIYFYNSVGKFIEAAFLGMAALILEKRKDSQFFFKFTRARKKMEIFLVKNKVFLTQINRKFGSNERSYRHFKGFFENIINLINEVPEKTYSENELLRMLKEKYVYLNENELDYKISKKDKISPEQRAAHRIKEEILERPKCKICNGILHPNSISEDHIIKVENNGGSKMSNQQSTHWYCNNSRDKLEELGIYKK